MDLRRVDGSVLVVVLAAMLLLTAVAAALTMASTSEVMVASNFRRSIEVLYAADLAVERAMSDLSMLTSWDGSLYSACWEAAHCCWDVGGACPGRAWAC